MQSNPNQDQALSHMNKLLTGMVQCGGSDLFIAADFPPAMKKNGAMKTMSQQKLTAALTRLFAYAIMNERQREEFDRELTRYGIGHTHFIFRGDHVDKLPERYLRMLRYFAVKWGN